LSTYAFREEQIPRGFDLAGVTTGGRAPPKQQR
jgi:hypothetical protein